MTVYAFGLEEHVYSGSGTNQGNTYYYRLGGRLIGSKDATGTVFYMTDTLGSILASFTNTPGAATLKGNQVFGPYGNARYAQGTINTAKGFTGQYNDALTGLDYYNARYYDPVAGVFLSADTVVGNDIGENPYAYVGGNPETYSDPSGQRIGASCYSQGCGIYALPHLSTSSSGLFLGYTPSQLQIPTGNTAGSSSPSSAAAVDNNTSSPCLVLGCRVTVSLDTGTTSVPLPSQTGVLCSGGFGIACTMTTWSPPTYYRLANPPLPVSFCLPSMGCLADENGYSPAEEEMSRYNGDIAFSNDELGGIVEGGSQPQDTDSGTIKVTIPEDKYRFIFGEATGSQHNLDRSNGLAFQMERLGVLDDIEGRELLLEHLTDAALDTTNVSDIRVSNWGTFIEKESLFAGPSGKFALFRSVWQAVADDELSFNTIVILGGG